MKQDKITFRSNGFTLSGIVHVPDDMKPGEKRPALMVLHGFGNNKDSANSMNPAELFCRWGYVTFRFDFRGCGESEGERGKVICLEQVEDIRAAVDCLSQRIATGEFRRRGTGTRGERVSDRVHAPSVGL